MGVGSSLSGVGGSSSNSTVGPTARVNASSSGAKSPRSVTIQLLTTSKPDVDMDAVVNNGRKRVANGTEGLESPAAVRRKIADGSATNGVHKATKETTIALPQTAPEEPLRQLNGVESSPEGPCKRAKVAASQEAVNGTAVTATACVPELTPEPAVVVSERMKSREWKIIEQATGMTFNSLTDSLLSLDSLRHTKMTSALRREAGKRVPRDLLKRSGSLGELLEGVQNLPVEASETTQSSTGRSRDEHAIWGMMWGSKCQWIFRRNRPVSEPVLRAALVELMDRHVALRTELRDPMKLFSATQSALTVFELWQRYGRRALGDADNPRMHILLRIIHRMILAVPHRLVRSLQAAVGWSLMHAWPRVGPGPCTPDDVPLRVLPSQPTAEDADARIWRAGPGRCPPFQASLIAFGQGTDKEGALVHLAVSHMMSDGFCVVALLDDLAYLVASVERRLSAAGTTNAALCPAGVGNGGTSAAPNVAPTAMALAQPVPAAPLPPLPPVRNVFEVLEARIGETIRAGHLRSDAASGTCITREPVGSKVWHDAACVFGNLPLEVVTAIRRAAARLGVPDDIAMLTILGIALSWFEGRKRELLAIIVPQRDGPGHNDMVGLFADVRHLSVCTDGLNFVGVALRLHHVVKERLWCAPPLATQYDMTFVNFEWTDFEERHGFTQHVNLIERAESSFHPLRIAVDQPSRNAWRMRVAFDKKQYNDERRTKFFTLFERSLQKFVETPLEPVWPDGRTTPC